MKVQCFKITFTAFATDHYCYIPHLFHELDAAEASIHELCTTACIIQSEIAIVSEEEYEEHSLEKLLGFISDCKMLEKEV